MISYHPKPPDTKRPFQYAKGFNIFPWDDLEIISEVICKHAWSPIIWKGGNRKKINFLRCDYLVLDFDDGTPTMEDAADKFCEYAHIIAPTKSHQKEKDGKPACDRFRLIVPFAEPVTDRARYEYTAAMITKKVGADKSVKDGGRFFWPCTTIYSIDPKGMCADTKEPPREQLDYKPAWWRDPFKGPLSDKTINLLENGVWDQTERNPAIYTGAMDMLRHGWTTDQIYTALRPKTNLPDWRLKDAIYRSAVRDYRIMPFRKRVAKTR